MKKKYGGFGIRVVANLIDSIILALPVYVMDYLMFSWLGPDVPYFEKALNTSGQVSWTTYDTASLTASLLICVLYYGLLTSRLGGTLGKLAVGLRVVGETGGYISFGRAVGRYFSYIPSSFLYIGYLMVAFTEKKQGLHDFICKTYVVHKEK